MLGLLSGWTTQKYTPSSQPRLQKEHTYDILLPSRGSRNQCSSLLAWKLTSFSVQSSSSTIGGVFLAKKMKRWRDLNPRPPRNNPWRSTQLKLHLLIYCVAKIAKEKEHVVVLFKHLNILFIYKCEWMIR